MDFSVCKNALIDKLVHILHIGSDFDMQMQCDELLTRCLEKGYATTSILVLSHFYCRRSQLRVY